jgi:hypothetical protein
VVKTISPIEEKRIKSKRIFFAQILVISFRLRSL